MAQDLGEPGAEAQEYEARHQPGHALSSPHALEPREMLPTSHQTSPRLKYGIEVCFESQFPSLFGEKTGEWCMRQALIERINTLLMRLYDPDGRYARFGRLDATENPFGLDKKPETSERKSFRDLQRALYRL